MAILAQLSRFPIELPVGTRQSYFVWYYGFRFVLYITEMTQLPSLIKAVILVVVVSYMILICANYWTYGLIPILSKSCHRSCGCIVYHSIFFQLLDVPFEIESLDCDPIVHGYDKNCNGIKTTIEIWLHLFTDNHDEDVEITFYLTFGDGFLILGNDILNHSFQGGPGNIIHITAGAPDVSAEQTYFTTYIACTSNKDRGIGRIFFPVVLSKTDHLKSFFSKY